MNSLTEATPRGGEAFELRLDVVAGAHGDDGVQAIVDDGLPSARCKRPVERADRGHVLAGHAEGHDAGGAAEGRRDGAGLEVVRIAGAAPDGLVEMAVGVDAAGQTQLARGVDGSGAPQPLP